jgi:hypothetical protein
MSEVRPSIKDFFPPEMTLKEVMDVYKNSAQLFKYTKALDVYIDHMEADRIAFGVKEYTRGFNVAWKANKKP